MRKIASLAVAGAVLLAPVSAGAKTLSQKGEIVGDPETKITLSVKTSEKDPRAVLDFMAKNVFTRCDDEQSRVDFTVSDPIPVRQDKRFESRLVDGEGGVLRIAGKVKDDGRATVGSLKTNSFKSADGRTCKTPKQRFKTG